jgi:Zn finger protein HypA/HybF involved in hydrogenase expression
MKARLQLTSGAFLEFDEDDIELRCTKCSEWFQFDARSFDRECPICNRTLFNRVPEK